MDDAPREVMTKRQVAELLQIDVRTLERLMAAGQGPPSVRFGRSRRFIRADVMAWLEAQREERS